MSARSPRRRRSSGWLGRQRPIRAIHPRADGTPPGKRLARRVNGTMKTSLRCWLAAIIWIYAAQLQAQEIAISYPGLSGESASLWMAREGGYFKDNGIDAKLVYMEGGRLSIQSLVAGHTQFMSGDAVSALSAVAGGAALGFVASAKNILPE